MSEPTREAWVAALRKKDSQEKKKVSRQVRQIQMAEAPMKSLTGHRDWDAFLQMSQPRLESLQGMLDELTDKLVNDYVTDPNEIMKMRMESKYLQGSIEQHHFMIDLPKQIIEQAQKASEWLQNEESKTTSRE